MKIKINQAERQLMPQNWEHPAEWEDFCEVETVNQYGQTMTHERNNNAGIYSADELATIEKACDLLGFEFELNGVKK